MATFDFSFFNGCGTTLETICGILQKERKDILYVCDNLLYTAKDLKELKKVQGFKPGSYTIGESCLNPEPTWTVSSTNDISGREFWFFRKDVVEFLVGHPVDDPQPL